jgi:capsular polysaccharide biosynthesis protein
VLSGRCALLTSDWAGENFGHFLLDLLPRLHLLEATGMLAGIDHVLVPHLATTEARTLLARTGLESASLVELGPDDIVTASELVVTSFPGSQRTTPRWAARYLRKRFSDPPLPVAGPRLVYLARGEHVRAPIDEPALIGILGELGFTTVHPDRQPGNAVLASADVVVGANAASLANVVFCAPGTTLVELVPTDHAYPYFLSAALAADVDYVGVGCTSTGMRPHDAWGPSSFDFTVDPDVIVPLLVELSEANRPGVSAAP